MEYLYYFGVLAVLIVGIYTVVAILKRLTQNKVRVSAQNNDIFNSKNSSLFIQEVLPIDQKNKIIIIGRDNLRHVILLGENHSNLIETVTPEQLANDQFLNKGSLPEVTELSAHQPDPYISNIANDLSKSTAILTTNIGDIEDEVEITIKKEKNLKSKLAVAKSLAEPVSNNKKTTGKKK